MWDKQPSYPMWDKQPSYPIWDKRPPWLVTMADCV